MWGRAHHATHLCATKLNKNCNLQKALPGLRQTRAGVVEISAGRQRQSKIASELGVSRRTLARRLASDGLSFRTLLDRSRFDLAKRYLQERDLPISEIAWLLGYRETSAFNHAFKRWTGRTPKGLPQTKPKRNRI
jgi:AraC-like DNA-binding protein